MNFLNTSPFVVSGLRYKKNSLFGSLNIFLVRNPIKLTDGKYDRAHTMIG
jgi:hypothetical protein